MSEYQYYEFRAIDKPLTEKQMGELRSYSTRARITPTSFVNDYSWGRFKGDKDAWMEKYFDAFLYLANWGTHVFKVRLPSRLLNMKTVRLYCSGEGAFAYEKNGKVVLTFLSEDEGGGEWVEGEGSLSSLISVRSEIARGDLRCLYLGWLLCVQNRELDEEDVEPPVPPGLGQLSASLESLVEFLRIDSNLIHVAAQASQSLEAAWPRQEDIREWVRNLPVSEKDDVLARLIAGEDLSLTNELSGDSARNIGQRNNKSQKRTSCERWAIFSAQPRSAPRNNVSLPPRRQQRRRHNGSARGRQGEQSTSKRSPRGNQSFGIRWRTSSPRSSRRVTTTQ